MALSYAFAICFCKNVLSVYPVPTILFVPDWPTNLWTKRVLWRFSTTKWQTPQITVTWYVLIKIKVKLSDVFPRSLKNHQNIQEFVPDCKDFKLHCLQINSDDLFPVDLPALKWYLKNILDIKEKNFFAILKMWNPLKINKMGCFLTIRYWFWDFQNFHFSQIG